MQIKGTEIVEKRNALNEIRNNSMTLQELRFFSIYLSKINARDESTRVVKFKLEDLKKIMEIGKINIKHFKNVADSLLGKVVHVPNEDGSRGFTAFQIFKECKVYEDKDNYNQWYVEIDAHDRALPLMFNLKNNYFKYEVWNALRLKSRNQLHMYELLKQYEKIGVREIPLNKLKDWLGLSDNEYPRWDSFKKYVLNACQIALKQYTDIKFEYELIKTGRKITGVRFLISKNEDYEDPLKLSEFIDGIEVEQDEYIAPMQTDDIIEIEVEREKEKDKNIKRPKRKRSSKKQIADNNNEDMEQITIDNINTPKMEKEEAEEQVKIYEVKPKEIKKEVSIQPDMQGKIDTTETKHTYKDKFIEFLAGACNNEFSEAKMLVIKNLLKEAEKLDNEEEAYNYLMTQYSEINAAENIPRNATNRRFGLLKWFIRKFAKPTEEPKKEKTDFGSFTLEDLKRKLEN